MKKIALVISLALIVPFAVFSQHAKPSASFKTETYDFGDIKEDAGKVSYSFEFTNTGGQPLVVHNVSASCGCTSPEWTKTPVAPGAKGFVKATFDPINRPGNFNKTVTVSSNSESPSIILRITGKVNPKELTVEDEYPRVMGGLRLKAGHIAFTRVAPGSSKVETLEFLNSSSKPIKVSFDNVPAHITIKVNPEVVQPSKKSVITATFDAAKKDDWGFVVDQIFIVLDGDKNFENRISLSATIEEDFSSYTPAQMASAPKVSFPDRSFYFGTIKQGDQITHAYIIKNEGKSDLIIRKVKASCGCTATQPKKLVLAPKESSEIVTVFNSAHKSGIQNNSVTVITNDPTASTMILQMTGTVTEPNQAK